MSCGGMLAQGKEANTANQGAFRACEELVIEHLPAQPWIKKKMCTTECGHRTQRFSVTAAFPSPIL